MKRQKPQSVLSVLRLFLLLVEFYENSLIKADIESIWQDCGIGG